MALTLGYIDYLNCVPFFHYLKESGFSGDIIRGVPSHLNKLLREGTIDACPSSSFEYGLNWADYVLLPNLSISSVGPVGSVLLFSPIPPEELSGIPIALTGESATSVNLLRILLPEFYDTAPVEDYLPETSVETVIQEGKPALLIGDRALRQAKQAPEGTLFDLGELWTRHTGLPFVFALWMVRKDSVEKKAGNVHQLIHQLYNSLDKAWKTIDSMAHAASSRPSFLAAREIKSYWELMSFELGEAHQEGLSLYFRLCVKHGLLKQEPLLNFIPMAGD